MKFSVSAFQAAVLAFTCVFSSSNSFGQVATVEPGTKPQAQATDNADQTAETTGGWTADSVALQRVTHDIEYMASDEMGGRKPGTPGIRLCEDYIVAEFKKAGVKPLADGTYFQPVEVPGPRKLVKAGTALTLSGPDGQNITLELGSDYQQLSTVRNKTDVSGELVFVGYGITAKEHNYDDFQGVDLRGKVAVLIRNKPQQEDVNSVFNREEDAQHAYGRTKAKLARAKGAVAVLIVNDSVNAPDEASDELVSVDRFKRTICPMAHVRRSVIDGILKKQPLIAPTGDKLTSLSKVEKLIDSNLEAISQPIKGWSAALTVGFGKSSIVTNNIIGVVEGEGPLANETVVVGGHYDHLGLGGGFQAKDPSRIEIHNGADDNATGTAAVIELARRFAQAEKLSLIHI